MGKLLVASKGVKGHLSAAGVDPQGRPLPGQSTGTWVLVRDGYRMPTMRCGEARRRRHRRGG